LKLIDVVFCMCMIFTITSVIVALIEGDPVLALLISMFMPALIEIYLKGGELPKWFA